MSDHEESPKPPSHKLSFLKSPVVTPKNSFGPNTLHASEPDLRLFGDRFEDDTTPRFQKHEDASLLELFYDLFFAANFSVFSQNQDANTVEDFRSYVGYFGILWATWLVVSLYDVRFVTDSLFERAARGVQLGVMVGFAVVAPKYSIHNQDEETMRNMSFILCISRLCLAVEYASILWHIRRFRKHVLPMVCQIMLNLTVGIIYFGLAFGFKGSESPLHIGWYVLLALEIILTFIFAYRWPMLSFEDTHLMKRMGLLTVIILGDGIVVLATNVVTITKGAQAWNSQIIGSVTAAAVTIYFVFLAYFDWMRNPKLPSIRQALWTVIHFPMHLALVLFMQGYTQSILWGKVVNAVENFRIRDHLSSSHNILSSVDIVKRMEDLLTRFVGLYPPRYQSTIEVLDGGMKNLTSLSESFWHVWREWHKDENQDLQAMTKDSPDYWKFIWSLVNIEEAMENSLLESFGIDVEGQINDNQRQALAMGRKTTKLSNLAAEDKAMAETVVRMNLVFIYTFIAAGATLILMTLLTIISRTNPWSRWGLIRTGIFIILASCLCCVSIVSVNNDAMQGFMMSAWELPTVTIVWVVVLLLTHLRNPPPLFFLQRGVFQKKGTMYHQGSNSDTKTSSPRRRGSPDTIR